MIGYLECFAGIGIMVAEAFLIFRRNRTIICKGKEDLLPVCLMMLAAVLLLSPQTETDAITALGSCLLLTAAFFSMGVRRGISARGIEKFCWYIPWQKADSVRIEDYQLGKVKLTVTSGRWKTSLIFQKKEKQNLITVVDELSGHSVKCEVA